MALQNHSQHVPPYQFQRGGGNYWLNQSFRGGRGGGGGGGWRALSFDISILSRGQINFQPTPIFVNKNSSFALPELAFVIKIHWVTIRFQRKTSSNSAALRLPHCRSKCQGCNWCNGWAPGSSKCPCHRASLWWRWVETKTVATYRDLEDELGIFLDIY